jgi:hypothetical protein
MRRLATILLLSVLGLACQKNNCGCGDWTNRIDELYQHNADKVSISQGVTGTLTKVEGNCMPPVDQNSCKEYPVERTLHIFEYTTLDDVEQDSPTTFSSIQTNLVGSVTSDREGFFELTLTKGIYSLFIEENGSFYANGFDGTGGIQPFEIGTDSVTVMNTKLDYAVY